MTLPAEATRDAALLRRGRGLEAATLAWNLVGIVILAVAALRAHSVALAGYLTVQTIVVFATGYHPQHSPLGIVWTAITAAAMFVLAAGKKRTGRRLANRVLIAEGRVTVIDGVLALAVLVGLTLNAALGWWWADPAAGLVIVYYALKEARAIYTRHD